MRILERIKKLGKRFWSIVGIFALLSGLFLGYYQFFYEKRPSIFTQIISEVNVLDIHEPLQDLQILFQGNDIQEKKLNLRIYTVRMENTGGIDILQSHFDQNDNWGIKVENARIIETRFVNSNSDYIRNNLLPQIHEDNTVKFNKIIFDQNDYFTIELLVLHDKNNPPRLYQIGKIAGIQENNFEIFAIEKKEPFLVSLFHGNWVVQVARAAIYLIIFIIILLIVALISIKLEENKKKKERSVQAPRIDEPASGNLPPISAG